MIFPCNGNGLEALDCLGSMHRCIGFVDDTPEKQHSGAYGYRVFGRDALLDSRIKVLAVPGGPRSFRERRKVIDGLEIESDRFATVIHPGARVSPLARVGYNVLIMAGVVITSNAVIGNHVCILPNTVVHHDVTIGEWTLIGSSVTLAGNVSIGQNCYIGSGSTVMNGVSVCDGALIGISSNVIRNVPPDRIFAGNPARDMRAGSA